ncbi:hypothetical protein G3A_19470 [Bacillus sp. 17376]|nr:hypothetical protein G3A_19470 [Bacillus sp. 17376]
MAGPKRLEDLGAQLDKRLERLGAGVKQFSELRIYTFLYSKKDAAIWSASFCMFSSSLI